MIPVIAFLVAVASVAVAQPVDPTAAVDPYLAARAPALRPYGAPAYDPRYAPPAYNRGAYVPPARVSYREPDPVGPPRPYNNAYQVFTDDGGSFSQQEDGDESGAKRGSYTIQSPEGFVRTVDYVADEFGFRATVRTNEPGTGNESPADVNLISEPLPAGYVQPGPQGVGYTPYTRPYQPGYRGPYRPARAAVDPVVAAVPAASTLVRRLA